MPPKTADAADAFKSVRREKLIWFSPQLFLWLTLCGPAAPGHQPSTNGLLPAFDGNTKPSATPNRDPGSRLWVGGILCQICLFRSGARPTHQQSGEAVMTDRGVTIVTGGASGIGLAIAKALLGEGWKV